MTARMGPVHVALPSDVARSVEEAVSEDTPSLDPPPVPPAPGESVEAVSAAIGTARRPVLILGLDLDPRADLAAVRAFVDEMGVPAFVTPKAKGLLAEDHPLFAGVCAGVAGDAAVLDLFARSDLLVGLGFEPVESDKLWHHTMPLVSIGPVSIASGAFRPRCEAVGEVPGTLAVLGRRLRPGFDWEPDTAARFREDLRRVLRPAAPPRGLSGYELTRALRALFPRETVLATDVGSIKSITTQAWEAYEPLTFFESNGLSAMSYGFPAAMAARLEFPERPVVCTIGDGGFGMTLAEIETCVRERIHFVTVVYNDSALSLIDVAQRNRGYPTCGVRYGSVDFSTVAAGLGAWSRRAESLDELVSAVEEGRRLDAPVVIEAIVDPAEYAAHHPRPR